MGLGVLTFEVPRSQIRHTR